MGSGRGNLVGDAGMGLRRRKGIWGHLRKDKPLLKGLGRGRGKKFKNNMGVYAG